MDSAEAARVRGRAPSGRRVAQNRRRPIGAFTAKRLADVGSATRPDAAHGHDGTKITERSDPPDCSSSTSKIERRLRGSALWLESVTSDSMIKALSVGAAPASCTKRSQSAEAKKSQARPAAAACAVGWAVGWRQCFRHDDAFTVRVEQEEITDRRAGKKPAARSGSGLDNRSGAAAPCAPVLLTPVFARRNADHRYNMYPDDQSYLATNAENTELIHVEALWLNHEC